MLSFEQLAPSLHKWAYFFKNMGYEHWELINAVWAKGSVQKLPHINLASNRIKWDMLDYMRKESGSRPRKRAESVGKFVPKTISLSNTICDNTELVDLIGKEYRNDLDIKDFFEWLIDGFSRSDKLITKLIFLEGFGQAETGDVVGVHESSISQKLSNILKRMKAKLLTENPTLKTKINTRPIKTKNSSEYNRIYYQTNKYKIAEQRSRKRNG